MRSIIFAASLAALSITGAAPPRSAPPPKPVPQLDQLFHQLAAAGTDEQAQPIEDDILALFLESGSASVDLLMTRAAAALASGDMDSARQLLDVITKVAPDYAEGWHQRGKLQAVAGDDEGAIVSLQKAITLNPRQFAAMSELGAILVQYGDKRDALKLLRRAQALNHHLSDVDREVRLLSRQVEGDSI
jgi:Flp pilus assembly protein TadD